MSFLSWGRLRVPETLHEYNVNFWRKVPSWWYTHLSLRRDPGSRYLNKSKEGLLMNQTFDAIVIGGECGFKRTGFLQIVAPEKNDQLRGNVEMQKRIGILTDVVSAEEVSKIAPMFKTDDFELAAY